MKLKLSFAIFVISIFCALITGLKEQNFAHISWLVTVFVWGANFMNDMQDRIDNPSLA